MATYPIEWSGLVGSPRRFEVGVQLVSQGDAVKGQATAQCVFDLFVRTPNTLDEVADLYWTASASTGWSVDGYIAPLIQGTDYTGKIGTVTVDVPVTSRRPLDWHMWVGMDGIGAAGYPSMAEVEADGYIPFAAPATPTGVTAARVSDTRTQVSWTLPQDNAERVESVRVSRWDVASGATKLVATLAYATSYTDRSCQPNNRYRYTVQAVNRSADGVPASSGYLSTRPGPAGNVHAGRTLSGDVQVTWVNAMRVPGVTEVWDNPNGSYAGTVKVGEVAWPGTSWTGAASTTQTHVYYVKHRTADSPILTSDDSPNSNVVPLPSPPYAPAITGPAVMDPADGTPVEWLHQSADTTGQQAYELGHRLAGAATWATSGKITGTVQAAPLPPGTYLPGDQVETRVRTWGVHPDPGPWSPTHIVPMDARPSATVLSPAGTVNASLVTVQLGYHDPEGAAQSAAVIELVDPGTGQVLETVNIDGPGTAAPLASRLADGATYEVRARVRDGAGQWSNDAVSSIAVDYLLPPVPAGTVEWVPQTGAAIVTIGYVEPSGLQVAASTYEVRRDGLTVAVGLAPEPGRPVTLTDPTPPTTGAAYELIAWSDLPSSATLPVVLAPDPQISSRFWLNAGPGWSTVASLSFGAARSRTTERARTVRHYSGRPLPVETIGDAVTDQVRVKGQVWTLAEAEAWRNVHTAGTTVCYRDPHGTRLFGSLGPAAHDSTSKTGPFDVSAELTVTDYREE